MARRRRHEAEMEINLIPMIDIMLILLIFFMVATTIKHSEKSLPIELPRSAAAMDQPASEGMFVVGVDAFGNKYIGSEKVTTSLLHDRIRSAAERDTTQPVRIDADRKTPYEQIVEVIELCQFEGLHNVRLHTRSPQ